MRTNRNTDSQLALLMMTFVIATACIAMSLGCSDDNVVEPVITAATGSLVAFSDCLSYSPDSTYEIRFEQTAVKWEWDGKGNLSLQHAKAAINCCPVLSAEITIIDGVITVKESDSGLCDCYCLANLDYEIVNLLPGTYKIIIDEQYFRPDDDPLEFNVTLRRTADSGVYIVDRLHYPWFTIGS